MVVFHCYAMLVYQRVPHTATYAYPHLFDVDAVDAFGRTLSPFETRNCQTLSGPWPHCFLSLALKIWVVVSDIFYFHPLFGEDEPILAKMFQIGWNHQLEIFNSLTLKFLTLLECDMGIPWVDTTKTQESLKGVQLMLRIIPYRHPVIPPEVWCLIGMFLGCIHTEPGIHAATRHRDRAKTRDWKVKNTR